MILFPIYILDCTDVICGLIFFNFAVGVSQTNWIYFLSAVVALLYELFLLGLLTELFVVFVYSYVAVWSWVMIGNDWGDGWFFEIGVLVVRASGLDLSGLSALPVFIDLSWGVDLALIFSLDAGYVVSHLFAFQIQKHQLLLKQ